MTEPVDRRRLRVTLQHKLLAVMLVCVVVPIVAMGLYLFRLNERTLREKVGESLANHLLRKDTSLQAWLGDRTRESMRWSASFVVYEGLESLSRPGDHAAVRRDLEAYLESLLGHYRVYESLFIVDAEGRVLASTREEKLEDWVRDVLGNLSSAESATLSPLRASPLLGRPTQLLLQPIVSPRPERRGQVLGYFVQRLDLRELETVLAAGEGLLSPAVWLLDGEGHVLLREGKVVDTPGTEAFPLASASLPTRAVEAKVAGVSSVLQARTLGGGLAGALVAAVPASDAYRALEDSRGRLLVMGILAVLLIFALSFLSARGILHPIQLLGQGARRVADGDLDVFLPVRGGDEIADLTRAFNDMAARIREGRTHLEAARDELARTNEGLRAANRTLETLAITDGLTSLFNHRHFQDTLEKELLRCEEQQRPLSLLLIDIDHFKQFNDRWGHQEGDSALRRVAAQITKNIRATDMAFRYGGEELAVLLPFCPKPRAAEVAEKLRVAVRNNAQRPGRFGDRLTVSIGVATFPEDGRVSRGLVDAADASLYTAKAEGRDRVVVTGAAPVARSETSAG